MNTLSSLVRNDIALQMYRQWRHCQVPYQYGHKYLKVNFATQSYVRPGFLSLEQDITRCLRTFTCNFLLSHIYQSYSPAHTALLIHQPIQHSSFTSLHSTPHSPAYTALLIHQPTQLSSFTSLHSNPHSPAYTALLIHHPTQHSLIHQPIQH